ncbi:uncharacterized protein LOC131313807 [Rhododendron vialii]|uniref:uncharacterized protein LOC131313807 n=1 Tax=Rhododendron vialii TaxID=182163 RepID=UPI00265F0053|nr:uncharacterized protein LOC131313807 [Rhododendron vialii]
MAKIQETNGVECLISLCRVICGRVIIWPANLGHCSVLFGCCMCSFLHLDQFSNTNSRCSLPCGMVVLVPFRRWVHVKHRNPQTLHGGFYCLLPIRGQRVIAVVGRYRHGGQLEYKAYNVDRCWYIKRISQLLVFAPTMLLPQSLWSSFEGIARSTWILLRHGSKAWPIQVVDTVMRNGWREFRTTHGIASNYKLILMCERKSVFNVIILDENDIEVSYNWTMLVNEHWREFHSVQGNLITACSPSTILRNLPLIKSGYCCIPEVN